jgi:hypothetical protein
MASLLAVSSLSWAGTPVEKPPVRTEAVWVWGGGETESINEWRYFRGTASFNVPPRVALFRISADTRYSLWINGSFVADGPVRGGPADGMFDRLEVSKYLQPGSNTFAVLVHHSGNRAWRRNGERGGLFAQMDWLEDGHRRSFISSEEWKTVEAVEWARNATAIGGGAGYFEDYDARKAQPAEWTATWFDDSGWDDAEPASQALAPVPGISSRPRAEYRIKPEKKARYGVITETAGGESPEPSKTAFFFNNPADFTVKPCPAGGLPYVVYDFGRIIAGSPRIETDGGVGAVIEISYSEEAGGGAGVYRDLERCDRYTCRGGMQSWGPQGVRGFRFVRLKFRNLPAPLRCRFWAVGDKTPAVNEGTFRCSDRRLNAVWKACVRTLDLCTFDALVDNPTLQAVSAPDILASASASYVLRSDREKPLRSLRLVGQTLGDDQYLSGYYPQAPRERADENGLVWILALAEYYRWTGDAGFIQESLPGIKLALSWYESRLSPEGLLDYSPSRVWIDGDDRRAGNTMKKDCDGVSVCLNALYAGALDAASALSGAVGNQGYSADWKARAAAVRAVLTEKAWNKEGGYFYDCISHDVPADNLSQQANTLGALYAGLPADRTGKLLNLIGMMGEQGHAEWALIGTPYFERYRLEALADNGKAAEAVRIIRQRWGGMLADGATTFGEKWEHKPGRSMCQARSAHPAYFLVTRVLGVTPAVPGMSKVRIAPQMAGLESASGRVPTPFGMLEVEWEKRGEGIAVQVSCPEGVEAVVELPLAGINRPVLKVRGKKAWREGQPAPEGVVVEKTTVSVQVGSGRRSKVELY